MQKQTGFTIVELLIVIVVIAILAAVTVVAYNGISQQAKLSSVQTDLSNIHKAIQLRMVNGSSANYADSSLWNKALHDAGVYEATVPDESRTRTFAFCATADRYAMSAWKPLINPEVDGATWYYYHSEKGWQSFAWNTAAAGATSLARNCAQILPGFTWSSWSYSSGVRDL